MRLPSAVFKADRILSKKETKVVGALPDAVAALPERNISSALHAKRFSTK
jgi:hypothetical protein